MQTRFVRWINSIITHSRDYEKPPDFGIRVLIHIPIGLVMGIPVLGWGLILLFIYYEHNEDQWVKDVAFKDVFGAMVGYTISTIFWLVLIIWLVRS